MMSRKHFIDNIRWVTVILVLVYHVFFNFNAEGVLGSIGNFADVQYQDVYLYIVYPWFMALLFLVAGVGSRYSLDNKSSSKGFIRSRTLKLLVPSTIGLFVFQWILGYLNASIAGSLDQIPSAVKYPVMVLSGVGPLWFIQELWVYSLLLVLIRKIFSGKRIAAFFGNEGSGCKTACTLLLLIGGFLLMWGASQTQIDNPSLAQNFYNLYRPFFYIVPFLMGYYVFALENVQKMLQRMCLPLLIISVAGAVAYVSYYFGTDYTSSTCLQSVWTNIYAWVVILAVFACFKAWADKTSPFTAYMTRSSFGLYIVHMMVCTATCYYLKFTTLPIWSIYILSLAATLLITPLIYEVLRRIPFVRWCVFGIKVKRTASL